MVQDLLSTPEYSRDDLIKLAHLMLLSVPNVLEDAKHFVGETLYARSLELKKGTVTIGKTHLAEHVFIVLQGRVAIASSDEVNILEQGHISFGGVGKKRLAIALEDSVVMNVHANDGCRDVEAIENRLTTTETKEELIEWLNQNNHNGKIEGMMKNLLKICEVV